MRLAQKAYICVCSKSVVHCTCHFVPEPPLVQISENSFLILLQRGVDWLPGVYLQ